MILGTAAYMVAGAGAGQAGRQARRHLGVRLRALRDAHRKRALRRRGRVRHARVHHDEGARLGRLPATTPTSIRRLLRRWLVKDRRERLPDITDARLEIDDARTSPGADAHLASAGNRIVQPAGWHRAWPWPAAALVAMLLVAVAGLSVLYLRQVPAIEQPIQLMVVPPDNGLFVDDGFANSNPMMQFALSPDGRQLAFIASRRRSPAALGARA